MKIILEFDDKDILENLQYPAIHAKELYRALGDINDRMRYYCNKFEPEGVTAEQLIEFLSDDICEILSEYNIDLSAVS